MQHVMQFDSRDTEDMVRHRHCLKSVDYYRCLQEIKRLYEEGNAPSIMELQSIFERFEINTGLPDLQGPRKH